MAAGCKQESLQEINVGRATEQPVPPYVIEVLAEVAQNRTLQIHIGDNNLTIYDRQNSALLQCQWPRMAFKSGMKDVYCDVQ